MRSARSLANETGKHLFLATVTLALLVPVIWVFTSALRSIPDFFRLPPSFFPREWTLVNFAAVFTQYPQTRDYYLNSALISAAVVPLTMTICCLAGYGFARLEFPGRNQIFWALVVTMYMPIGIARIFSIYELTAALHLLDTRLGLILPYLSLS